MRNSKKPRSSKKTAGSNTSSGSSSNRKKKKSKNIGWKIFKVFISLIVILGLIASVAMAAVGLAMIKTAPPLQIDKILALTQPARIYDSNQELMDSLTTGRDNDNISLSSVPKSLQNAFIAIEDERFYEHSGIDWYRFGGAMKSNVKNLMNKLLGKSYSSLQGASTITQQLIKQKLFYESSIVDRYNVERKVQEMYLAWQLDKNLSKDKILEAYLNTTFLGGNSVGVKAAAKQYFAKDNLDDLTLLECAFLASTAQLPSKSYLLSYNAVKNDNGIFYSKRTYAILGKMLELGFISKDEYDSTLDGKVKDDTIAVAFNFAEAKTDRLNFESYSRLVFTKVAEDFRKQGKTDSEIDNLLANGGLKIFTPMDREWQLRTQEILDDEITSEKTKASDYLFPRNKDLTPVQENLQSSAVIMDYHTGEVKVIVGGRGEQDPLSYNRAASSNFLRPPGSCIKPLTVYGPAIDTKKLTAGSIIDDSPLNEEQRKKYNVSDEKVDGKIPQYPRNAPKQYDGYLNLRFGLKHSKNTVAMKTVDIVGLNTAVEYGRNFGLHINDVDANSLASMSLGQLSGGQSNSGANPLILATAYGTFGNNGVLVEPVLYTKVVSSTGEILLEPERVTKEIISPDAAYIMYDMLKEPVSYGGTGPSAKLKDMDTRGKTGTSGDKKDYWFTGLTPYYSASVWVGNDDSSKIENGVNRISSYYTARIWNKIMTPIHEGLENKTLPQPSSVTAAEISKDSGTLPSSLTYKDPRGNRVYTELFINGTAPTTRDKVHVVKDIVVKNGKEYLASKKYSFPKNVVKKVYILKDPKPFWGDDRQYYITLDEKYAAPTEVDPVPDNIKEYIDFWGLDMAQSQFLSGGMPDEDEETEDKNADFNEFDPTGSSDKEKKKDEEKETTDKQNDEKKDNNDSIFD